MVEHIRDRDAEVKEGGHANSLANIFIIGLRKKLVHFCASPHQTTESSCFQKVGTTRLLYLKYEVTTPRPERYARKQERLDPLDPIEISMQAIRDDMDKDFLF